MKTDILIFSFCLATNSSFEFKGRGRGAHQVANHMRQSGYNVQVVSMVEKFTYEELCTIIDGFVTPKTIIGVSIVFRLDVQKFIPLGKALLYAKQKYKGVKLVCGGNPPDSVNEFFDKIFHGYSEQEFLQYVNLLRARPTKQFFDIQNLDFRWDDSDCIMPQEALPIEISRGCIFKCAFCSYKLNGKKKLDYLRDAKLVAKEISDNYNRFGITRYYFLDDTFNDSNQKLEALHEEITKLPFKIQFWTYVRADLLAKYPNQMKLMKEMGLKYVFFGIETFNNESAKAIHKGGSREKLKKFLENLHDNENDINVTIGFIAGLPRENLESLIHTIEYTKRFNKWLIQCSVLGLQYELEHKSDITNDPSKYGYTFDKDNWWINDTGLSQKEVNLILPKYKRKNFFINLSTTSLNSDIDINAMFFYDTYSVWIQDYKKKILERANNALQEKIGNELSF